MKLHRLVATAAVATAGVALLAGCVQSSTGPSDDSSSGGKADKNLTVFVSADTNIQQLWQQGLIPAFEKQYKGYKISVDFDLDGTHDQQTLAALTAATAQKKDPGYDLVDAGFVTQAGTSGLLTKVSEKNIPNFSDVAANTIKLGVGYGIPYRASSVLLAYNTKMVSSPPKTLKDLLDWIKANPGKFTYCPPADGGSGQGFVTTVLDSNLSASDRAKLESSYDQSLESKWTEGFNTLASLNPYIYQKGVYPAGNTQVLDLLASGQIAMAPVWSDQFTSGVQAGTVPSYVKSAQIENPSMTGGAAYLGIPKTAKNQAGALLLANWLLTPKAQAIISNTVAGYPVIGLSKMPSDIQKKWKDADISNLRPPYYASVAADMNKLWAQNVPGK